MIDWDKVKYYHTLGWTTNQIKERLDASRSSVQRILRNIKIGKTRFKSDNSEPVYSRLCMTKNRYIDYLKELYESGLSQRQIALKIGVHKTTVEIHFRKFNLKARPYTECDIWQRKSCELTSKQQQILDGILLGDGHLDASTVSARFTYGCKFRETLIDIRDVFNQLHFSEPWQSKIGCWHFKSSSYNDLLPQQKRWYANKKKIVPDDLELTPESCFWWFIGDGYQVNYGVCLCTDNFTKEDNSKLIQKLLAIGFSSHIVPSSNRLRIEGNCSHKFLQYVSANRAIPKQYLYKWGNHRRQSCPK